MAAIPSPGSNIEAVLKADQCLHGTAAFQIDKSRLGVAGTLPHSLHPNLRSSNPEYRYCINAFKIWLPKSTGRLMPK